MANGQYTFTDMEYAARKRATRKDEFLRQMDKIIPWTEWVEMIRPYYPKGERGRPVRGIETMTRMYLLQMWFNLSDEGVEDAIYDSYAMRSFMRIDFMEKSVPDATTLLKFRHLLEEHDIGKKMFADISKRLEKAGLIMHGGTIVDATIISAPSSTKNATGKRDPEMHQTKKGTEWRFGMKCHVDVDAGSGYVHTAEVTAANVHDVTVASKLLREDDEAVYGDSGYLGISKRPELQENEHFSRIDFRINRRPKSLPHVFDCAIDWEWWIERRKSSVRCKVECVFRIIKCQFGYRKTAYRCLHKNANHLFALFISANLYGDKHLKILRISSILSVK